MDRPRPLSRAPLLGSLLALLIAGPASGYTITSFGPTADAAITTAIAGLVVESFEDVVLDPRLQVEHRQNGVTMLGGEASGTLDALYAPQSPFVAGQAWDGSNVLINRVDNGHAAANDDLWTDVVLHFTSGLRTLGVGLSDIQDERGTDQMFLNGVSIGFVHDQPGYVSGHPNRNVYLLIAAEPEDADIASFGLAAQGTGSNNDAIFYDRLALGFTAVPEPGVALAAIALLALPLSARASRRARSRPRS